MEASEWDGGEDPPVGSGLLGLKILVTQEGHVESFLSEGYRRLQKVKGEMEFESCQHSNSKYGVQLFITYGLWRKCQDGK